METFNLPDKPSHFLVDHGYLERIQDGPPVLEIMIDEERG